MAVFTVVANVVLVVAALVTVWFAAKAAASGADATRLAKESLVYSRETMEAVRAAHDADERDRRRTLVREIDRLVGVIHKQAKLITSGTRSGSPGCNVPEQASLARLLVGVREDLPYCAAASVPGPAIDVLLAVELAKAEVAAVLEALESSPGSLARTTRPLP